MVGSNSQGRILIDRNLLPWTVLPEENLLTALQKITDNQGGFVLVLSPSGVLEGVLTDGDIRAALLAKQLAPTELLVADACNRKFLSASVEEVHSKIHALFSESIRFVPLVDGLGRAVALARVHAGQFVLGKATISDESPVFVIAEIGINHNGKLDEARRLIDAAVVAGANCAKFQMRHMPTLYRNGGRANDPQEDLGTQYTLDLLSRFLLSDEDLFKAFAHCREAGIMPLCTPWDLHSLGQLESQNMAGYKIASADLTYVDLLIAAARTGKPLICSTGMAAENEVREAVSTLRQHGANYALLHCNATYPTPFKDVQLNYLTRLKEIGECIVGYSGHERGIHVAIAAVARGARIIEKHLTLDKEGEGNDHKVSLLPGEFKAMVAGIREVEEAMGSSRERMLTQGERLNRENLAKSLVANKDLREGETISEEVIAVRSPGRGLQPNQKSGLLGRKVKRDMKEGDFFFPSDLVLDENRARRYQFQRPWGVAVRYHDFQELFKSSNPDLLEFHLSYKDLDYDFRTFVNKPYDTGLVVHSPDVFAGDHLLNLASADAAYRKRSMQEMQRVIDLTRRLKPQFRSDSKTFIVASVGGFGRDGFIPKAERRAGYARVAEALSQLDTEGVEILPQTLPPFPWYFGGQLFLSLFMDPEDTAEFCREYGYRICFDTSHSKLACNHFKWSFEHFVETVGPFAAHLHVVDARGVDGEGVQIGEGEIDFGSLAKSLARVCPKASFIPEIWQGHKNGGEGFWKALERLEKWF